jgi:hypothetical protein
MSGQSGTAVLSNRQRKILVKTIKAQKAAEPKPEPPQREEYIAPEVKHEDDRIIPGLTGRGAIQRLDTLGKLWEAGKITAVQYSAGRDYLAIVENYFASASGLARLSEEAGRVGGASDPIRLYIKARPWDHGKGYIPTQRPRNPSPDRAYSDGWSRTRLIAMSEFSRMARLVAGLPRDPRTALCVLVIDPNRPDLPALSLAAATRRMFGDCNARRYAKIVRWLGEAMDEIDAELIGQKKAA